MQGWNDGTNQTDALAAFGVEVQEPLADQSHEVWPENWAPVQVFRRMCTQWAVGGMGGYVGLRYESLAIILRVSLVPRADWPEVVDCVQIMERHALQLLNKG